RAFEFGDERPADFGERRAALERAEHGDAARIERERRPRAGIEQEAGIAQCEILEWRRVGHCRISPRAFSQKETTGAIQNTCASLADGVSESVRLRRSSEYAPAIASQRVSGTRAPRPKLHAMRSVVSYTTKRDRYAGRASSPYLPLTQTLAPRTFAARDSI